MNVFMCAGRLGGDAELRTTQGGTPILSFSVANKVGYGERESTLWVRCAIFGKRAEGRLIEFLKKGTVVSVTGELNVRAWTDKTGASQASADLVVREVELLSSKSSGGESREPARHEEPAREEEPAFDDEIPF